MEDCLETIIKNLDSETMLSCRLLSKHWKNFIDTKTSLWMTLLSKCIAKNYKENTGIMEYMDEVYRWDGDMKDILEKRNHDDVKKTVIWYRLYEEKAVRGRVVVDLGFLSGVPSPVIHPLSKDRNFHPLSPLNLAILMQKETNGHFSDSFYMFKLFWELEQRPWRNFLDELNILIVAVKYYDRQGFQACRDIANYIIDQYDYTTAHLDNEDNDTSFFSAKYNRPKKIQITIQKIKKILRESTAFWNNAEEASNSSDSSSSSFLSLSSLESSSDTDYKSKESSESDERASKRRKTIKKCQRNAKVWNYMY